MNDKHQTTGIGGKCPHFDDGRPCRGCEYASNPNEFDPCCLYGHPDARNRKQKE